MADMFAHALAAMLGELPRILGDPDFALTGDQVDQLVEVFSGEIMRQGDAIRAFRKAGLIPEGESFGDAWRRVRKESAPDEA